MGRDSHSVGERVEEVLDARVRSLAELDGGMIGTVSRVDLTDGRTVVAKVGETPLSVEGRMLQYLDAHGLPVPTVLFASDSLLLLEYVDGESQITPPVERDIADHLAALHAVRADRFGFPFDTLIGPLPQENPWTKSWIEFYRDQRLQPIRQRCLDAGVLESGLDEGLGDVLRSLGTLLEEPDQPALLHGDLWENNVLAESGNVTAFLDPACYYGHPEIELAYADWTDTVGEPFFEQYRASRPIEDGFFARRRFVYRLYPVLIHLLLFGSPYEEELRTALNAIDV